MDLSSCHCDRRCSNGRITSLEYLVDASGTTSTTILRRKRLLGQMYSRGFPYSKRLVAHKSCINALTLSRGDGRFLASGGDDLGIQIWDFHREDMSTPICHLSGHRRNIFCLDFSASNRYLLSGGADDLVIRHDVSSLSIDDAHSVITDPMQVLDPHRDSIRGISGHPMNDELFLTASDDGRILRHDGREPAPSRLSFRAQDIIQLEKGATDVRFHPHMEYIFATSEDRGDLCLRDMRMAFGPAVNRTQHGVVRRYNTKISRRRDRASSYARLEVNSIAFDRQGMRLAATVTGFYPVIYPMNDDFPLAILTGTMLPDGTPPPPEEGRYANACTMKSSSFGGPGLDEDIYFVAGSDDFRGYVYRLPESADLIEACQHFSREEWEAQAESASVAFFDPSRTHFVAPVDITTPFYRLTGHKSIVNTALFHPTLPHILTSGIENDIVIHSPFEDAACVPQLRLSPTTVRRPEANDSNMDSMHFMLGLLNEGVTNDRHSEDAAEIRNIRLFDHILRQESGMDIFDSHVDISSPRDDDPE